MKSKYSVLFAACLFVAFTLVAWSLWSASVTAQGVVTPLTEEKILRPIASPDSRRNELGASQQSVPVTGTPIGLPPGSHHIPGNQYPTPSMPRVTYGYRASVTTDAKTLELIAAYQKQQGEVNQLVKTYGEAKTEEDKNSVRDQIIKATTIQFDLRQQVRERELEQLKKRLTDVETTVQKRNELKEKIVEKRVADILREPDQLEWESLGTSPASVYAPSAIRPTPALQGQILPQPEPTRVARTIVRIEETTVVDDEGNTKVVRRPVKETVYEEIGKTRGEPATSTQVSPEDVAPFDSFVPGPVSQFKPSPLTPFNLPASTANDYRSISPTNMTVAEAEARVRFAEAKREQSLSKGGKNVDRSELKSLEAELDLAKLIHARTQVEYEGRTKLLELDVRQAEANCEQARAAVAEATDINKRSPKAIPEPELATLRAAVEQAQISLERAKTVLDVHQKTNDPKPKRGSAPPVLR